MCRTRSCLHCCPGDAACPRMLHLIMMCLCRRMVRMYLKTAARGGYPQVMSTQKGQAASVVSLQDEFQVRFWKLRQGAYADYLQAHSGLQIRQVLFSSFRLLLLWLEIRSASYSFRVCVKYAMLMQRITHSYMRTMLTATFGCPSAAAVPRAYRSMCHCRVTWRIHCTSITSRTHSLPPSRRPWSLAAKSLRYIDLVHRIPC